MSKTEFMEELRDCYGELSTVEVIGNADLVQYIHWLERDLFQSGMPVVLRGVFRHFRRLISDWEKKHNVRLNLKLDEIERKIDNKGPPVPPRSRKIRVIETEEVPVELLSSRG